MNSFYFFFPPPYKTTVSFSVSNSILTYPLSVNIGVPLIKQGILLFAIVRKYHQLDQQLNQHLYQSLP